MQIRLKKKLTTARIRSPFADFTESEESIEIRKDPLTGDTMRISRPKGLDRIPASSSLSIYAAESKECFFCENRFRKDTPRFPESLGIGERVGVGRSWLFPNLSGFSRYSGVGIFTTDHFLSLSAFTEELIIDTFKACQQYLQACWETDRSRLYCSINWNYLLPSGSSILHPHLQPVADSIPTNYHRRVWKASTRFYSKNRVPYWQALLSTEENGPRFLGKFDTGFWVVPFAPMGFFEFMAFIGKGKTVLDFNEREWSDLAAILIKIFGFYAHLKHNSFNMVLFSPPIKEDSMPLMPCLLRIATRPVFDTYYRNDITFYEKYHQETMLDQSPEGVAESFLEWCEQQNCKSKKSL